MTKFRSLSALIFILPFLHACKKDGPVTYSNTPEITFVSISPSTVTQFEDSITIVVSYTDGDGDLGENNPNTYNLFVTDQRISITYPFRIQELSPSGSTVPIKGKLNIVLKNTGITDGSTQQSVVYKIYVKDRAGHQSNTVTTSSITVVE